MTTTVAEVLEASAQACEGGAKQGCAVPYCSGRLTATTTKDISQLDTGAGDQAGEPDCQGALPLRRLVGRVRERGFDAGMATAEYAVGMITAAGFAGVLLVILRSSEVKTLLLGIIRKALDAA